MSADLLRNLASKIKSTLAAGAAEAPVTIAGREFLARLESGNPNSFRLEPKQGAAVTSNMLLAALFGALPPELPDLKISTLVLDADSTSNSHVLPIPLEGVWDIPRGPSHLQIGDIVVTAKESATDSSGSLVGKCRLGGQVSEVNVNLPGDIILSGTLPPIDLLELVKSIVGPVLKLPAGLPSIGLRESTYSITFQGEHPTLVVRTSAGAFKDVTLVISHVSGEWGALAQIELPTDGVFSKLSDSLSQLDALLPVESPRLLLSSFATKELSAPPVDGVQFDKLVSKGLSLLARLKLEGGVLGFFGKLLRMSELPLTLAATDSLAQSTIRAQRDGKLELVPGFLTIQDFAVSIEPATLAIEPNAQALLTLFGFDLPTLRVSGSVNPGDPSPTLKFLTEEPFTLPALPGVKVNVLKSGLSINPQGPEYDVLCTTNLESLVF